MKKIAALIAAGMLVVSMSVTAYAGEWKKDARGWWYQNDDGGYPSNGWALINGIYYYFDSVGYMLENTVTPDGYYVDASGAWVQNAQNTQNTAQQANTAAGVRYRYQYSLDEAGNQYREGLPDLYISSEREDVGEKLVTYQGTLITLYMHPRTSNRVWGTVNGVSPQIEIYYETENNGDQVTLIYAGHKSVYRK